MIGSVRGPGLQSFVIADPGWFKDVCCCRHGGACAVSAQVRAGYFAEWAQKFYPVKKHDAKGRRTDEDSVERRDQALAAELPAS